jgi:hypothetical protein
MKPPAVAAPRFDVPAFRALRELLRDLGKGGLPRFAARTPEEDARLCAYHALNELCHLLDQFRRRVERGERVRLVVTDEGRRLGCARIALEIVEEGASGESLR